MRKLLIITTACMLFTGTTWAQSAQGESHGKGHAAKSGNSSNSADVKDSIKKMENEMRQGVLKGDPSASEKYLAADYHTISGANGRSFTRDEALQRIKSGATKYSSIDVANDDVATFGKDVAISHGEVTVKGTMDGRDISGKYHYARTWL